MRRRLGIVIASAAGLAIGLAVGLLLRPISADWFEAVGTWVGVVVSTTAVVLAVLVFRSEDFMRRMEIAREAQRDEAVRLAARQAEDRLAQAVACSVEWAMGHEHPNGVIEASALRLLVQNNTDSSTVSAIRARQPQMSDLWYEVAAALRPGEVAGPSFEKLAEPMMLPEGNGTLNGTGEFRYTVGGIAWTRRNGFPPERL